MKKSVALVITALVMLTCGIFMAFDAGAETEILYVKAGGTGDGSSEAEAFGSVLDAVDAAATRTDDVDVVIVGEVTFNFSASYDEPEHSNKITIRGKDENAKLKTVTNAKVWKLGGELEIRDLAVEMTKDKQFIITSNFYPLTFGEGVVVTNTSGVTDTKGLFSVRAVDSNTTEFYNSTTKKYTGDSTIVLKSGRFEDVSAFAHNGSKGNLDGTCRLYLGPDAVVNNLTVCRNVYNTATNAEVYIDGAVVRRVMAVTDRNVTSLGTTKKSGVTDTFKVVITKNTDINEGWDHSSIVETYFHGLSGCSPSKDNGETHLDRANFILEIEESVYDAAVASTKVRTSTFDEVKRIADGTGVPADILGGDASDESTDAPTTDTPDTDTPDTDAPETDTPDTDAPDTDTPDTPEFDGEIIYVRAGGTGDGSSEDEAFGSITDAVDAAATKNREVCVVIVGTVDFDFSASYKEPTRKHKLTIMGKDDDAKLRVKTAGKVWTIGGEFEMRELNVEITKNSSLLFTTQFYYTTFGEGLNVTNTSGAKEPKYISVRTADSNTTRKYNSKKKCYVGRSTIILESGKFEDVSAFAHNGAKGNLSGTCKVYVGQDAVVNNLTVCRNVYKTATNAEIIIDGGIIRRFMAVTDRNVTTLGTTKKSGVTGTLKVVITKNTDINAGWDHTSIVETYFHGLSGCSPSKDNAESHLGRANYILEIEEGVYDATVASDKLRLSTFDSVKKIADGTGAPDSLFDAALNPDTSDDVSMLLITAAIMLVALSAGVLVLVPGKRKMTK